MDSRWRFVKVPTLGNMKTKEIQMILDEQEMTGLAPNWREIPDDSTPALNLTKLWPVDTPEGIKLCHQITVPLPIDAFPETLKNSVQIVGEIVLMTIIDEHHLNPPDLNSFKTDYSLIIAYLNNRETD